MVPEPLGRGPVIFAVTGGQQRQFAWMECHGRAEGPLFLSTCKLTQPRAVGEYLGKGGDALGSA